MDEIIKIENLKKTYDGEKYVLDDLSFSAHKGELIIIKGKSGSGKSTLLNILGLLDDFNSGIYNLTDVEIKPKKHNRYSQLRSKYIGFIFQSYHLIDSITVEENILLPYLYSDDVINNSVYERMNTILEDFSLLGYKNKKTALLSGGEKQRVAIARAIIKNPLVIIADEPTGNLDYENSLIIVNYLKKQVDSGKTVILVTHDNKLLDFGDTAYNLQEGKLNKLWLQWKYFYTLNTY